MTEESASSSLPPSSSLPSSLPPSSSLSSSYHQLQSNKTKKKYRGFQEVFLHAMFMDVENIIEKFVTSDSLEFAYFHAIWKAVDFGLVYSFGFFALSTHKIIAFLHQYLLDLFKKKSDIPWRSGVVFFLYCLYSSQPHREGLVRPPIKLSPHTFNKLTIFCSSASVSMDVAYVFYKLCEMNAFQLYLIHEDSSTFFSSSSYFSSIPTPASASSSLISLDATQQLKKIEEAMAFDIVKNDQPIFKASSEYENYAKLIGVSDELTSLDDFVLYWHRLKAGLPSRFKGNEQGKSLKNSLPRKTSLPDRPATAPPFEKTTTSNFIRDGLVIRSESPLDLFDMAEDDDNNNNNNNNDNGNDNGNDNDNDISDFLFL